MPPLIHEDRIPPVRGIIPLHNDRGHYYARTDVLRWLRLNRYGFNVAKVDVFARGPLTEGLRRYIAYGSELELKVSLRTDGDTPPGDLRKWAAEGLHDVFITPETLRLGRLHPWYEACREASLPLRLQVQPPFYMSPGTFAREINDGGVAAVNVAAYDPFLKAHVCAGEVDSKRTLDTMVALVTSLEERQIEVNLLHVPFCVTKDTFWPHTVTWKQFFLDHQQYRKVSYDFAQKMFGRSTSMAGKAILMLLGKYTLFDNPIDDKLLPWIVDSPWLRARVVAWHKVTRHLRLSRSVPKPAKDTPQAYVEEVERLNEDALASLGPTCGACSLRIICDQGSNRFQSSFPGIHFNDQRGEVYTYPLRYSKEQRKYYDSLDEERRKLSETQVKLAENARETIQNRPHDREIDSFDYDIDGQWSHQLPGGVRWYGFTNTEKVSTPLARLQPPFTLSVIFGGGIAEYIGFSLGRHTKLLCPMEAYRHQLVLHVEADGSYALVRDGKPVRPLEFEGAYALPTRLSGVIEPRISIWNIDHTVVTQNVLLWEGDAPATDEGSTAKYSIILVSVRYARRLQAVLQSVVHQEGFDVSKLEIVVAHVPGLDTTEDILESLSVLHPEVRIVRSTFDAGDASAKGFMINESLKMATGEWVMLLDADTLIPPDMFAKIEEVEAEANFIVPDGRKLLGKEDTARILLGEVEAWREWGSLLEGPGEFRHREMEGVPIGFCQCIRASCFDEVQYYEVDHFEGADWQFSVDMIEKFGKETRLSGTPVLHLEHGGSKWYGTDRHF